MALPQSERLQVSLLADRSGDFRRDVAFIAELAQRQRPDQADLRCDDRRLVGQHTGQWVGRRRPDGGARWLLVQEPAATREAIERETAQMLSTLQRQEDVGAG